MKASEQRANRAERTLRLQELVETWRTRAAMYHAKKTLSDNVREETYILCTKELQEVLDS